MARLASGAHWRRLTITIVALCAAIILTPMVVPKPALQENRPLAERPDARAGLTAFRSGIDAYASDHFPARTHLIAGLNRLRMLAGASGSSRVIVGRDGWLFYDNGLHLAAARNDPPLTPEELRLWLRGLAGRTEQLATTHTSYLVIAPPMKETVYPQFGPAWFKGPDPNRRAVQLTELARASGAGQALYLYEAVAAATRDGAPTFSRHDTHWTGYGAYAGYAAMMRALHARGVAEGPRPLSDFQERPARARDLALMLGVASLVRVDYPEFHDPQVETRLRTTWLSQRRDWTAPHVVDTGEVGKPVLLLTRDSFSNALLPFLYSHFSRIILTHVDDGFWRPDLIDRFHPDIVVLEVIEAGLANSQFPPPEPAAAASRAIDAAIEASPATLRTGPEALQMSKPGRRRSRTLNAAPVVTTCAFDVLELTSDRLGPVLRAEGWVYGDPPPTSGRTGVLRLFGPQGDLAAPLDVNGRRDDVRRALGPAGAATTGFQSTVRASRLKPGDYKVLVYRPSGLTGWVVCQSPVIRWRR